MRYHWACHRCSESLISHTCNKLQPLIISKTNNRTTIFSCVYCTFEEYIINGFQWYSLEYIENYIFLHLPYPSLPARHKLYFVVQASPFPELQLGVTAPLTNVNTIGHICLGFTNGVSTSPLTPLAPLGLFNRPFIPLRRYYIFHPRLLAYGLKLWSRRGGCFKLKGRGRGLVCYGGREAGFVAPDHSLVLVCNPLTSSPASRTVAKVVTLRRVPW